MQVIAPPKYLRESALDRPDTIWRFRGKIAQALALFNWIK